MISTEVKVESLNQSCEPEKKMSKTFAVIGDPINHSLSPNIHSAAFRDLNLDSSYIAYRIPNVAPFLFAMALTSDTAP